MGYYIKALRRLDDGGYRLTHASDMPSMAAACWPLDGTPNRRILGPLAACFNGYHVLRPGDLCEWSGFVEGPFDLFLVEPVDCDTSDSMRPMCDKVVLRQARVVRKIDLTDRQRATLYKNCDRVSRAAWRADEREYRRHRANLKRLMSRYAGVKPDEWGI